MAPSGRDRSLERAKAKLERVARAASAPARRDGFERDRHAGNTLRPGDIFQAFAEANRQGVQVGGRQRMHRAASADLKRRVKDLRHESRFIRLTDKVKEVNGHAFADPRTIPRTQNLSQSWGGPSRPRPKEGKMKSPVKSEEKSPSPMIVQGGQVQALRSLQQMMGGGKGKEDKAMDGKAGVSQGQVLRTMRSSLACLLSAGLAKATESTHVDPRADAESADSGDDKANDAPAEEEVTLQKAMEDNDQGLILDFAGFILDLGGGSLRAAWRKIDTECIGRLALVDWVVGLESVGYEAQDGEAEQIFRSLDQDRNSFLTLRDFQHLQPFLGIVLAAATRKQHTIESESKDDASKKNLQGGNSAEISRESMHSIRVKSERSRRQSHWPGQEKRSEETLVDDISMHGSQTRSSSSMIHPVLNTTNSKMPEVLKPVPSKVNCIMVFVNGSPSHTGVYLRFPRPVRDMQDLCSLLDRVCRPLVGRITAVFDQSLKPVQAISVLKEGGWYVVKGEEKLAPPVLFLRHRAARGAHVLLGSPVRASTAPSDQTFNAGLDDTIRPGTSPASTKMMCESFTLDRSAAMGPPGHHAAFREPRPSTPPAATRFGSMSRFDQSAAPTLT
eukprot:gnl/MRDRNA2_/MRDRNA2_99085_c0_seq1.p1 gnl/MRDRNA2_/MRDRNA2_99085_c0~~gnl/MRDRNA2_/MRDRNA2_99085_c0_seq1.p1  ORF type:complete len:616 (+),score=118.99 gnl/MRDRNA2_/MRDRNA2_99085_c0_seq1:52-1899(+)